jgi:hypothetical protein
VLRTEPHDLAAARIGFEREFQREPRVGAIRMIGAELRDLVLDPRMVAVALRQFDADASGRVVGPHRGHGRLEQGADGLEPMPLHGELVDRLEHGLDMSPLERCNVLRSMLVTELLDTPPPLCLRDQRQPFEVGRCVMRDSQGVHGTRRGLARADHDHRCRIIAAQQGGVFRHEFFRSDLARKRHRL